MTGGPSTRWGSRSGGSRGRRTWGERELDALTRFAPGVVVEAVTTDAKPAAQRTSGRVAAAMALHALGVAETRVGRDDLGRPIWPHGSLGSISHGAGLAVAAVSTTARHLAVGVDVERRGALPLADALVVLSRRERALVVGLPGREADELATALWSAKEAAFKAWDAWSGGLLSGVDPTDLTIEPQPGGALSVRPSPTLVLELARRSIPGPPALRGGAVRLGAATVSLLVACRGDWVVSGRRGVGSRS